MEDGAYKVGVSSTGTGKRNQKWGRENVLEVEMEAFLLLQPLMISRNAAKVVYSSRRWEQER